MASQQAQSALTKEKPPRISRTALAAAAWALFALALLFYVARLAVRWSASRRLYLDDAWATLAFLILLALSICVTLAIPPMYDLLLVGAQMQKPGPDFKENSSFYLKMQFALTILFWSCLWCVKGCFLAFFRRLTSGLKGPRYAWWGICVFTGLAYIGCVATYPIACSSFVVGHCETDLHIARSKVSIRYSTAVDMLTDALIIALPLYLALRVQLPLKQRLALGAIFSLGIIIMIFAVIRVIVTNTKKTHIDPTWLALWSQIEASAAVIVSSLAPFKSFFTQRKLRSYQYSGSRPKSYGPESYARSHQRVRSGPPANISLEPKSYEHAIHSGAVRFESADDGESLERILVTRDVEIDIKTVLDMQSKEHGVRM